MLDRPPICAVLRLHLHLALHSALSQPTDGRGWTRRTRTMRTNSAFSAYLSLSFLNFNRGKKAFIYETWLWDWIPHTTSKQTTTLLTYTCLGATIQPKKKTKKRKKEKRKEMKKKKKKILQKRKCLQKNEKKKKGKPAVLWMAFHFQHLDIARISFKAAALWTREPLPLASTSSSRCPRLFHMLYSSLDWTAAGFFPFFSPSYHRYRTTVYMPSWTASGGYCVLHFLADWISLVFSLLSPFHLD